jgi:hypothetical protein
VTTPAKGYKRSWKNLLLNKRYQLRFTLFMVGLSAILMAGLGWWVMREANKATTVAMSRVYGEACPKIPLLNDAGEDDAIPMKLDEPGKAAPGPVPAGSEADAGADAGATNPSSAPERRPHARDLAKLDPKDLVAAEALWCNDQTVSCKPALGEPLVIKSARCNPYVKDRLADPTAVDALRNISITVVRCEGGQTFTVADAPVRHVAVQIDESSMTLAPVVPSDFANRVVEHWTCELGQTAAIDALERGRLRIFYVLIATGLALIFGLAMYGLKMTHRVAGPLFKVTLYLAKMKDGRFDRVYNLRKGDQLVDFYEHFKSAHAGIVQLEKDDIAQLRNVIAAAEAAGVGDHETIGELRAMLARKEKSLE